MNSNGFYRDDYNPLHLDCQNVINLEDIAKCCHGNENRFQEPVMQGLSHDSLLQDVPCRPLAQWGESEEDFSPMGEECECVVNLFEDFDDSDLSLNTILEDSSDCSQAQWEDGEEDYSYMGSQPEYICKVIGENLVLEEENKESMAVLKEQLNKRTDKVNHVELAELCQSKRDFIFYCGSLYVFQDTHWRKLDNHQGCVLLRTICEEKNLNRSLSFSDYEKMLKLIQISPACQVEHELLPSNKHLNFLNGTLHVESLMLYPHNPEHYFFHVIPLQWNRYQKYGSAFENFIAIAGEGNKKVRQVVLEMIAAILMGTEVKNFFAIIGPSGSGKSQLGKFLSVLLGKDQVHAIPSINNISGKFALAGIEGKKLLLCLDLPESTLSTSAIGILKQLVGDDNIAVEAKYQDSKTITHKPLFLCAGNHPIRIPNLHKEEALLKRLVQIPLTGVPDSTEMRHQLYQDLLEEASYIISEALEAYAHLENRNYQFTYCEIPDEYQISDGSDFLSAVRKFVVNHCLADETGEASTCELYSEYCQRKQETDPFIPNTVFPKLFAEVVRQMIPNAKAVKRVSGGSRGYRGLSLISSNIISSSEADSKNFCN